jgi:hypothetical protein
MKIIQVFRQGADIKINAVQNNPIQTKGTDARGKQIIQGGILLWL